MIDKWFKKNAEIVLNKKIIVLGDKHKEDYFY